MKKKGRISSAYLVVMLAIMYLPILLIIIYSFNESRLSAVWSGFSFDWYRQLFADKDMMKALANTVMLGLGASFTAAVIGTLGAVGLAKTKMPFHGVIEYLSTSPIITPEIILGMLNLAYFSLIGLKFGMLTLMIAHTAFCIPYVFMLVKARLVGMDKSLEEAALDLGASKTKAFFDIILPLIAPAIASGMLLSFAMSFDDVIISVFVTGVNTNTLPLKIYTQLKTGVTPEINALCTLMFCVTVLICILSAFLGRDRKRTSK